MSQFNDNFLQEISVSELIIDHFSGPSPTCEERTIEGDEWGVLKTTAVTWDGWDEAQHKVLPRVYWGKQRLLVRHGDVLVTKAGPRERCGVVVQVTSQPEHLIPSGKMICVRPNLERVLPQILAGVLAMPGPQRFLDARTTGMADSQLNFSDGTLLAAPVRIPPRKEHRKIARLLDAAANAIAYTKVLIAKLKAIKQGLLHDLLTCGLDEKGQFRDPVCHPDKFVTSAIGLIPSIWQTREIGSLLKEPPRNGYSPKEAPSWTGVLMLGLGCLTKEGFSPRQLKHAPANDGRMPKAILNDGDLLVSRSNTRGLVGLVGIYREIGIPCIYPDLMMRLIPTEATSAEFLECVLMHDPVRRQLVNEARGTSGSMVKINANIVMRTCIPLPDKAEQERILKKVSALDNRIRSNKYSLQKLRSIKKGLMQDLLTGRVRVNAEASAKET
jgi:type I restriction enzyme S subunit